MTEGLIRILRHGGSADRMAAAEALAALGPAALPALLSALEDGDPGVVKWAAAALRNIRGAAGGCRFC